jgi:peptidoglycan-N-acetylglucosamine deacetylase
VLGLALLLPLVAACGHAASTGSTPRASATTAAATPRAIQVQTVGAGSVLLTTRSSVHFTFRFVGAAERSWTWRVVSCYGDKIAVGEGQTAAGATTGSVTWDGKQADGSPANAGLYLVVVGARGTLLHNMATIGRVRFEPPVTAHVYRRLPAAGMRVALTFDDGGGKTAWYWILHYLTRAHAKGTFFPIGLYVGDYAKRMAGLTIADHMAIGSHTWSHPDLTTLSDAAVQSQLRRTEAIWWNDFRSSPVPYLRPPGGSYNAHDLALFGRLGYSRIILWDVDSLDWTNPGINAIVHNVLSQVRPGSIVLMHTRGMTPKALPLIIAGLQARHYQMVTVPELFKAAGIS